MNLKRSNTYHSNSRGRVNQTEEPVGQKRTEKVYFKLLQAIHHSAVAVRAETTGEFPVGMMRQATKLASFIKPSSPNPETTKKVKHNTDVWMRTNITILKQHYDSVMAELLQELPEFDQVALEKARAYGQARYKKRLHPSTIERLGLLVRERVGDPLSGTLDLGPAEFPTLQAFGERGMGMDTNGLQPPFPDLPSSGLEGNPFPNPKPNIIPVPSLIEFNPIPVLPTTTTTTGPDSNPNLNLTTNPSSLFLDSNPNLVSTLTSNPLLQPNVTTPSCSSVGITSSSCLVNNPNLQSNPNSNPNSNLYTIPNSSLNSNLNPSPGPHLDPDPGP